MKLYQYKVGSDGGSYLITVNAESNKEGLEQIQGLSKVTSRTPVVLIGSREGTLVDYLGEETMERLGAANQRALRARSAYTIKKEEEEQRRNEYDKSHS